MSVQKTRCLTLLASHLTQFVWVSWLIVAAVLGHAQKMDVSTPLHAYTKSKDAKVPLIQQHCSYM